MIQSGLPLIIVMPGAVYGMGDHSLIGEAFKQYLQGKLPVIPKKTAYCWGHVDDVVEGHILAMEKGKIGETYCIAGPPHTLEEVFRIAETITGMKPPRMRLSPWIMRLMSSMMKPLEKIIPIPPTFTSEGLRVSAGITYLCSNVKARQELDYRPRSVEEGLREILPVMMKELDL